METNTTTLEQYEAAVIQPFGDQILFNLDNTNSTFAIAIKACWEKGKSVEYAQEEVRNLAWQM